MGCCRLRVLGSKHACDACLPAAPLEGGWVQPRLLDVNLVSRCFVGGGFSTGRKLSCTTVTSLPLVAPHGRRADDLLAGSTGCLQTDVCHVASRSGALKCCSDTAGAPMLVKFWRRLHCALLCCCDSGCTRLPRRRQQACIDALGGFCWGRTGVLIDELPGRDRFVAGTCTKGRRMPRVCRMQRCSGNTHMPCCKNCTRTSGNPGNPWCANVLRWDAERKSTPCGVT